MEVILLERIDKLGQMGDVVSVKAGYARNYLLPQSKALRATDENKAQFETQRVQLEAANLKQRDEADAVGKKMDGISVALVRQAGEAGQLFGSVNARDIANALIEAGFTVTRQQVRLESPIKLVGIHAVQVGLHPEVVVSINANVARSEGEAEIQAKTGHAVVSEAEREAQAREEAAAEQAAADQAAAVEAEAAADEAAQDQAEEMFEEGAAPEVVEETEEATSDDSADDAEPEADADADAAGGEGDEGGEDAKE